MFFIFGQTKGRVITILQPTKELHTTFLENFSLFLILHSEIITIFAVVILLKALEWA